MDPITVIVTALVLGAAAGLKPTAEQAIKDAYTGLKTLIKDKYSTVSVDHLEEAPASSARRSVVTEDLANTNAGSDEEVLRKARELLDAVQAHAPDSGVPLGLDLARIRFAANLLVENIVGGVKFRDGTVEGDATFSRITTHTMPEPPKV